MSPLRQLIPHDLWFIWHLLPRLSFCMSYRVRRISFLSSLSDLVSLRLNYYSLYHGRRGQTAFSVSSKKHRQAGVYAFKGNKRLIFLPVFKWIVNHFNPIQHVLLLLLLVCLISCHWYIYIIWHFLFCVIPHSYHYCYLKAFCVIYYSNYFYSTFYI